jgi:uncharacterized membrane protein
MLLITVISCSPEHDGASNLPSSDGVVLNPNPDPLLASAAEGVLGPKCLSCHGSSGTNQKFLKNSGDVGLSELSLNARYVSPGQSNISLLAIRASDGSMPPGGGLNSSEEQAIKDWIDDLATINNNGPAPATFSEVETQILTPKCYTCHSGGSGGITFSDYDSVLFSVVTPGDLGSRLYQATVRPTNPMPRNSTALTVDELALMESWILNGAQND